MKILDTGGRSGLRRRIGSRYLKWRSRSPSCGWFIPLSAHFGTFRGRGRHIDEEEAKKLRKIERNRPNLGLEQGFRRFEKKKLGEKRMGAKNGFEIPNCRIYICRRDTGVLNRHGRVSYMDRQAGRYTARHTGVSLPVFHSVGFFLLTTRGATRPCLRPCLVLSIFSF